MGRVKIRSMDFVALDLEERVGRSAIGVMRCREYLITMNSVHRLSHIGPTVFYVVDVTFVHSHHGPEAVFAARMAVDALMQILHYSSIPSRFTS